MNATNTDTAPVSVTQARFGPATYEIVPETLVVHPTRHTQTGVAGQVPAYRKGAQRETGVPPVLRPRSRARRPCHIAKPSSGNHSSPNSDYFGRFWPEAMFYRLTKRRAFSSIFAP